MFRKRLFIGILFSLVSVCILSGSVFASSASSLLSEVTPEMAEELNQIRHSPQYSIYAPEPEAFTPENSYQIQVVDPYDMENFDLFARKEDWYIPSIAPSGELGYAQVSKKDGEWKFLGATCCKAERISPFPSKDILAQRFTLQFGDEMEDIAFLTTLYKPTDFVAVKAGGKEYVVSFNASSFSGFEQEKLYSKEDFLAIIEGYVSHTPVPPGGGNGITVDESILNKERVTLAALPSENASSSENTSPYQAAKKTSVPSDHRVNPTIAWIGGAVGITLLAACFLLFFVKRRHSSK